MRELRMKETGVIVSEEEYFSAWPNVSFAADWVPVDADWIVPGPSPAITETQEARRAGIELVDGKWVWAWEVIQHVPASVTMRQARLALLQSGKLSLVAPAIAAMPAREREVADIEWQYSPTVARASDLVAALATILGMTPAETDAMFILASKL